MTTTWEYSKQKETLRLIHATHQIAIGFYRLHGFITLPYPQATTSEQIVTLPDLPYLSIPRFWDQVSRVNIAEIPGINVKVSPQLLDSLTQLLPVLPSPKYQSTKQAWEKYEQPILSCICTLMPEISGNINSITIWPTVWGTSCSFNQCNKPPYDIVIWLRENKGVAAIVEAILTSLTRNKVYKQLGGVWQESEIIVDWLMTYSPLHTLLKQADPNWHSSLTILNTRSKQNGSLIQASERFMQKIGAPNVNPTKINLGNFSTREKEVMNLLITTSPSPVTTDQIGDILFKNNPDQYSLFAISKTIQRLRDKLEQNGISGSFIQTKRGEGYLLIS